MTQWGLDNLFNPGKRHMDDEKRRLQATREEVGDASGGRRIDLDSGKVVIAPRRPTATGPQGAPEADPRTDPATLDPDRFDEGAPADEDATADDHGPAGGSEPTGPTGPTGAPGAAPAGPAAARPSSAAAWSRRG